MTAAPSAMLTPAQVYAWGLDPIPLQASSDPQRRKMPRFEDWSSIWYKPHDWRPGEGIGLRCGAQMDGTYLYTCDYDHAPERGVDAPAEFQKALDRLGPLAARLFQAKSTSGRGRYFAFRCLREIPKTWLRDEHGKKIGDFLGEGAQVVAPTPDRWINGSLANIVVLEDDADVDAILEVVNYRAPVQVNAGSLDWQAAQDVVTKSLIDARGLPRALPSTCPGARVLLHSEPVRDTSHARYTVTWDLVKHGYDDTTAAALLLDLCDFGATSRKGKGLAWLQKDVARCLAKCRKLQPDVVPDPDPQPTQADLPIEIRDPGRPRKRSIEEFWHYLETSTDGDRQVMKTQAVIAAELNVGKRTVARWEAELRRDGRIERRFFAGHKDSYIVLLSDANTAPSQVITLDAPAPTRAREGQSCWSCGEPAVFAEPGGVLRCEACGAVPVVARLVDEALEMYGAIRHGPKREAAVARYVHANGRPDAPADWITRLCRELHTDRKQRERDAAFVALLEALSDKQLKNKLRGLERKSGEAHSRGSPGQAWVFGRMAWFVQRELEKPERAERHQRRKAIERVLREPMRLFEESSHDR